MEETEANLSGLAGVISFLLAVPIAVSPSSSLPLSLSLPDSLPLPLPISSSLPVELKEEVIDILDIECLLCFDFGVDVEIGVLVLAEKGDLRVMFVPGILSSVRGGSGGAEVTDTGEFGADEEMGWRSNRTPRGLRLTVVVEVVVVDGERGCVRRTLFRDWVMLAEEGSSEFAWVSLGRGLAELGVLLDAAGDFGAGDKSGGRGRLSFGVDFDLGVVRAGLSRSSFGTF